MQGRRGVVWIVAGLALIVGVSLLLLSTSEGAVGWFSRWRPVPGFQHDEAGMGQDSVPAEDSSESDSAYARGYREGLEAAHRSGRPHMRPFFFWPIFLIGGLFKFFVLGLLVLLGVWLLSGRRFSGKGPYRETPVAPAGTSGPASENEGS